MRSTLPPANLLRKDSRALTLRRAGLLALVTAAAILVHGYHPAVEDAEIYLPGIKRILNPALCPHNHVFFTSHAGKTFFPNLIAASIRISHLPFDWAILLWHFLSIFLLLWACWRIGELCFGQARAAWGGVLLVASLLTIPVAGTALYIVDQYLVSRSLSTPAILFAVISALERRYLRAALWVVVTGLIHPLMVVFGASYFVALLLSARWKPAVPLAMMLPLGLLLPASEAYRHALGAHPYFFLLRWQWYEWLGIFAPLVLLAWYRWIARRQMLPRLELLATALIPFSLFYFALALFLSLPRFAGLLLLQPMRSLHLLYVLFFVFTGGLISQSILRDKVWRWLVLFLPLCIGMFYAQRQLFPSTPHIEWPGRDPGNDWVRAFLWIRQNTPTDAYFALDPNHMALPGEDQHGFRALAERSMLADNIKDIGAVTMFPKLASEWQRQVRAQSGWKNFQREDFLRLQRDFGVDWVVVEQPGVAGPGVLGLDCPYQNSRVQVCQIIPAH